MEKIEKGTKLYFNNERNGYTVRSIGPRYAVCTKPFNLKNTTIYTVIDIDEQIRGTENLIFGMGAESDQDCDEMLERLESGETEISYKNRVPLIFREPYEWAGK